MLKVLLLNLRTVLWVIWWAVCLLAPWLLQALGLALVFGGLADFYEMSVELKGFSGREEQHVLMTQLLCFGIIGGQVLIYGRLLQLGKK